ncbi:uncharacterized protein At5g41620-like [Selaginella moellendorffii]|nr:uncharacterized protein At5g41620-like [Selaginella moellendorffii]|eukprot:XP_024533509.1 uncharacterized protein At5g41620-like [Selaginella moellendorffii]
MGRSKAIVVHQQQQHQARKSGDAVHRPANIRIRRAILAGKRGPTTPVPSWKLYENPSYDGIMAGSEAAGRQITISARKLAATLWELQELPLCPARGGPPSSAKMRSRSSSQARQRESVASPKHLMLPPPSPTTPVPHNATNNQRRSPYSDSVTYHSRRASEELYASETSRHSFEMESQNKQQQQQQQDMVDEVASRVKECLPNSNDFLKVLSHIRGMDQQQAGSTPLATVLRVELEHTRQRVRELEHANKAARRDVEILLERSESERAAWRAKEQERWRAIVIAAKSEAEEEKRHKRKAEHLNRKLARQLEETSSALSKAMNDLERERKARQLMEEVCDELAREIGQDKAEVEELKRESEKVREEVEEERRMLQMAEVWREERVQMKLAEARHELEEKNASLDRLRGELEEFLRNKSAARAGESQELDKATTLRAAVDSLRKPNETGSSAEEDLHSIDLNKESLYDRTQGNRWTYARNKQGQADNPAEKRQELRRKAVRGRRRLRRQRTYDENSLVEQQSTEQENGPDESCFDGRGEGYGFGPSRRIDTIPEQQELYMESVRASSRQHRGGGAWHGNNEEEEEEDEDGDQQTLCKAEDDFALEYAQHRRSQDGSTPTLSPLLHSSFPLMSSSMVATPQRNSWSSSGDVNWPRSSSRDNSLRAKLLEAKIMDEPVHHHHRV